LAGHAVAFLGHDLDAGQTAVERAIFLNPNSAWVLGRSGWVHNYLGDFDVARDHFTRAIRLSPIDLHLHHFRTGLAMALSFGEPTELEQALELVGKVLAGTPNNYTALQGRIEALVMLRRAEEAKETARTLLSMFPQTSISGWRRRWPHRQVIVDRMVQIYRTVGIPE
jgi:adenylate cyclase